jgi:hypothetical protein
VYLDDGELEIDNGATERAIRDIAVPGELDILRQRYGRQDSRDSADVHRFVQKKRSRAVRLVSWFRDVLARIGAHPLSRIGEFLPHNWKPLTAAA